MPEQKLSCIVVYCCNLIKWMYLDRFVAILQVYPEFTLISLLV